MIRSWLANLQPRERWVLAAGAALLLLIIGWSVVWAPLVSGTAELRQAVAHKQRLLINLQRVDVTPASAPQTPRTQETSLLVLVERTQRAHGLASAVTRTRPDGADGINVAFREASFDHLLAWLIALHTDHQVTVESASFSSARQEGLVSGELFLRRS